MNLIDAWKAAKEGQKIQRISDYDGEQRAVWAPLIKQGRFGDLAKKGLFDDDWFADDWEVVKEKKSITCALVEILGLPSMHIASPFPAKLFGQDVPLKAKVTIEWEE